jgi:hypothetical protein
MFYSRELFVSFAEHMYLTPDVVKDAGDYAPIYSFPVGTNISVMHRPIAVGGNVSLYEVPFDVQKHIWSMSAASIVCYPRHYVHWKNIVSLSRNSMPIREIVWQEPNVVVEPRDLIGKYDRVIIANHFWIHNYYHGIWDTMAPLLAFPKEIIERSHFLYWILPTFLAEALIWFGLEERLIEIRPHEYIWSENVYMYDRGIRECQPPYVLLKMREHVKGIVTLDRQPPSRYVFMNRKKREKRFISNMNEVFDVIVKVYKNLTWEWIGQERSVYRCATLFNSLRFFMAPHGAGLANILFMQPGTAFCEIQTEWAHPLYIDLGRILGLYHVVSRFPEFLHFQQVVTIDVEIGVRMVHEAMKCLGVA